MSKYNAIINLPHYESKNHRRMNRSDRAAQFAPFAALTGYEEAIEEMGRQVSSKRNLDDLEKEEISNKLNYLASLIKDKPIIEVVYFEKDAKKEGGIYLKTKGILRKIDEVNKQIQFVDKRGILIEDIVSISGDIFEHI